MDADIEKIIAACRTIFSEKLLDYGPVWLVFRWISLTDQIFIKLCRLRSLEEADGQRQVADTPEDEYRGIINYCLIGLMKDGGHLPSPEEVLQNPNLLDDLPPDDILCHYDAQVSRALLLLSQKNNDYDSAWRGMALPSITDQMLMKILRVKHILSSPRELESVDSLPSQLTDILNYSIFSLLIAEGSV